MGYVLTDADIDRLWRRMFRWGDDVEPNKMIQRPAVREWFAGLPIVSRDEVQRALGSPTLEEIGKCLDAWYQSYNGENYPAMARAMNAFAAARRASLDAAPTEPTVNEPTTSRSDLTEAVHAILDIVDLLGEGKPIVIGKRTLDRLREAVAKAKGGDR